MKLKDMTRLKKNEPKTRQAHTFRALQNLKKKKVIGDLISVVGCHNTDCYITFILLQNFV